MNTLSNYELNVMNTQQLYINLWNQISKKRIETEQKKVRPKKRICFVEQNYEEQKKVIPKKRICFIEQNYEEQKKVRPKKRICFVEQNYEDFCKEQKKVR